jgi:hypothetical protein
MNRARLPAISPSWYTALTSSVIFISVSGGQLVYDQRIICKVVS